MQRLGEILIERGVLSLTELHTALETCHRTGGRLGTQLLEFGYVEEGMLLEALSKQLGVPGVVKVKLGAISTQFKGEAHFIDRDDENYTAQIKGTGRDTGGRGNATANGTYSKIKRI